MDSDDYIKCKRYKSFQIYLVIYVEINGKSKFLEFLEDLKRSDIKSHRGILASLKKVANSYGLKTRNKTICDKLEGYDDLWEIKYRSIRLFCFEYEEKQNKFLIIVNQAIKKTNKANKKMRNEYDKAAKIKEKILADIKAKGGIPW